MPWRGGGADTVQGVNMSTLTAISKATNYCHYFRTARESYYYYLVPLLLDLPIPMALVLVCSYLTLNSSECWCTHCSVEALERCGGDVLPDVKSVCERTEYALVITYVTPRA
jgi:hypothetical protein